MPTPIWQRVTERVHPPCAICGGTDVAPLAPTDMFDSGLPTVICRGCGLIFTSPRLPSDAYARLYVEDYRRLYLQEPAARVDDEYLRMRGEFASAEFRWTRYREALGERPRLLDVGAGFSVFPGLVHQRLPEARVTGVEPDPAVAAWAAARWGIDLIDRPLETADLAPGSFTHVVLLHVEDPPAFLLRLNRLLAEGGQLLLEVPNIASPWRGISMLHPAHLTQFTPGTLRLALRRAGFEPLDLVAWNDGPLPRSMSVIARKQSEPAQPIAVETTPPDVAAVQESFARRLAGARRDMRVSRWKHRVADAIGPTNTGRLRRLLYRLRRQAGRRAGR